MFRKIKMLPIKAMIGAISVSGLITSEVSVALFSLSYTLPDGIIQKAALAMSGLAAFVFFLWFGIHAYFVEMDLLTGQYDLPEE